MNSFQPTSSAPNLDIQSRRTTHDPSTGHRQSGIERQRFHPSAGVRVTEVNHPLEVFLSPWSTEPTYTLRRLGAHHLDGWHQCR